MALSTSGVRLQSVRFIHLALLTSGVLFGANWELCSAAEKNTTVATNGTLRILVADSTGEKFADATLFVNIMTKEKGFKSNRDYKCDADGEAVVELPATLESIRVWARKPGHAPMFGQLWPRKKGGDGQALPKEFTFKLTKGTTIGGVVKNEDGQPIEGARVEVDYESGGRGFGAPAPTRYDAWLAYGEAARITDAEGRWSLDNVPPGDKVKVRLKLSHADYINDKARGGLQKEQNVSAKQLRNKTATIRMHRGYTVKGRITDPDGKPVKDAVVIWGDRPYWDEGSQEVRSNKNGDYQLPPLAAGQTRLTVAAPGWMPQSKKIDIGPTLATENIKLQPGKKLRIKFVDASGKAVPKVGMQISDWRGSEALYTHRHPNVIDLQIPAIANDDGVLEWSWAPDDAVNYQFYKTDYA